MHRYAIYLFLNLFPAEITVLLVANRHWNTLKIVCSGATRLWQTSQEECYIK